MKYFLILSALLFCFCSCVKDKPEVAIQPTIQVSASKKVYVINEGGFGYNQASVSFYDPATGQVIEDFYGQQNNAKLGDVAQHMVALNGNFYIVVNNSSKIIVCDNNFKKTGQINQLNSPRYIQVITNKKAYVSDFTANAINVVDLNANTKTGSIPCAGWTEKMVLIYNKVFVTNIRKNYLYVVDAGTDQLTDSIAIGFNTGEVVLDKNDKIWTLSSGTVSVNDEVLLSRIDPISNAIEAVFRLSKNDSPGNLCLNRTKDTLYFLNKGVFRFSILEQTLPQQAFIAAGKKNFYGLGISPNNYNIYVADVLDYTQKSNIYIFNAKGEQQSFFKAGIISNGFYFE
jgi:hypothetical protein